jgi:UDP-N-acetylmuramate dehydrogenase
MLIEVCRSALSHSLSGLEFAYGIPGTIGGAVYMNAGAYGDEICSVIKKVQILDDNCAIRDLDKDELIQLKHLLDKALIRMEEAK